MSQPVPPAPEQPAPGASAEPQRQAEPAAEPAPANRAARRAKAGRKAEPTHIGPRGDLDRQGRGGRPHTKRRR